MPAYLIVKTRIRDAEKIKGYLAGAPPLVAKHGGRYLVRGGEQEALEGTPDERRTVILEFPTMADARALFADPEYQEVRKIRLDIAEYDVLLVDGYEG